MLQLLELDDVNVARQLGSTLVKRALAHHLQLHRIPHLHRILAIAFKYNDHENISIFSCVVSLS